jgi:hypothetical protein
MSVNLGKIFKNMGKMGKIWEKSGKFGKSGKIWEIWENLGKFGITKYIFFYVLPFAMCLENILVRVTIILCV